MRRVRRALTARAAGLLMLPLLVSCVSVAEFRKLEYEVNKLKTRGGPTGGPTGERVADVAADLEAMRERIAALEGRIEVTEHQATSALEEAQAARRDAASSGAPARTETPPGGAEQQESAPSEELGAYKAAYDAWQGDQTEACIDRFRQFLQTYPSSVYADDAAYWLADCYFRQGDFRNAVLRFDDVVRTYPKSDKAAEALYRQGEALLRLKHEKAAQTAFQRVVDEYPDSARATEARRQLELLGAG
jgi:tol-pal system protein YbgF